MTLSDVIMIFAILLAPLLAVQVQKYLEHARMIRERRLMVFKTLMATRATVLSPAHVEALNMIDVEFYGKGKNNKAVREAWKVYLDHLANSPPDQNQRPVWNEKCNDLLTDLLYEMGKAVGYDFDKVHIKRSAYVPVGHSDIELEQTVIRGLVDVMLGHRSIPMAVTYFPYQGQIEEQHQLPQSPSNQSVETDAAKSAAPLMPSH